MLDHMNNSEATRKETVTETKKKNGSIMPIS